MSIPQTILELIQRFEDNLPAYRSAQYNEAQVREEFITPFFAALGWDVYNQKGASEKYKEVVHEAALKMAASTKAPDYAFRIGGRRVFFVEAKKPAVAIKDDPAPAYQLRRYAWSAKLPLSILTDFEEFAVYDCRDKPAQTDKASAGRAFYCTYREYSEHWDYLVSIFSPEAIIKGAFDRYAEATRGKRGAAEVDVAFLAEIEGWRDVLARNIALRNPGLSARELNRAVQQTIDRIIFLRIAEDRGIEPYQRLFDAAQSPGVYPRLCEIFRQADNRYNSGLFYFQKEKDRAEAPDTFTLDLGIDDKVLKGILQSLYYPASPYQFDMLPADILGQVYEQFLGRVIRLTPTGQAKVEEKPEVKKAGGVYYTPTYIVDYIVRHTLGPLLEGKTPQQVKGSRQVAPLRLLDPACGSGTFLIQAYQYLLDWYLEQYVAEGVDAHIRAGRLSPPLSPPMGGMKGGEWRLTAEERKAILLRHLYGVDIDPQAVEVTKLSLLLKVLEGENEATLGAQLAMSIAGQDRVLPDLSHNIRCGNSLIGPDYYQGQQLSLGLVDEETLYRINAFDWEQGFHSALMAGGFDAVIGNPPYGMVSDKESQSYLENHFETTEGRLDNYELFIELGIKLCVKQGFLGFIVPSPLLSNLYAKKLRQYILANCAIQEITNFGMDVFSDPTVHTCIIIVSKTEAAHQITKIRKQVESEHELQYDYDHTIPQSQLGQNDKFTFDIFIDPNTWKIIEKIQTNTQALGDICFIRQCIKTGNDKIYVKASDTALDEPWKPTLNGRAIGRYATFQRNLWIKYGPWLARNWKNKTFYETPKIVIRETGNRITATIDLENRYVLSSLYAIYPRNSEEPMALLCLLGLLNSFLATYFTRIIALNLTKGAFTKVRTNQLARLPIRTINFDDPADAARHARMVGLVEQMLDLHRRLPAAKTPQAVRLLQQQIDLTDKAIDALVYALYGLTEEEIAIVEGVGSRE